MRTKLLLLSGIFILMNYLSSGDATGNSLADENQGPLWVKQELTEQGVFNVPSYNYTADYDEYKMYSNMKGMFIDGLNYHGKPTKFFAWYGVPENIQPGEKLPAVILVHGGGSTAIPEWVKVWNDHGYIAISLALEGQAPGEKDLVNNPLPYWPTHDYSGPYRNGFFKDIMTDSLQDQWFYHAVADVILANSLIRTFPEVDTSKIGITGISWGGILTNVITGIDNRYDFAVPVYGCGYLYEAPTYIRQMKVFTDEARQFYMENWEPSLYVPYQVQPTLFVNGDHDCHFPMKSFTKTYKASPNEKYLRIEHNMVHGMKPGWMPEAIYHFSDYVVKGGTAPQEFIFDSMNKKGEIRYSYTGEVTEAKLYFTTDTADWDCANYEWSEGTAFVDPVNKTISGIIPEGALYFYVNGINNEGIMYSAPMKKVDVEIDNSDTAVVQRDPVAALDSFFFDFIPEINISQPPASDAGNFIFTTEYQPSGSEWDSQLDENEVYLARLTHKEGDSIHWDMRVGKGGQIYSFIGPYGESVPPNTRPYFDFNTSHWNDDVWQIVSVSSEKNNREYFPLTPELRGAGMRSMFYFIHGAGAYMNDTSLHEPFFSPLMASYYDEEERSYSVVNWGQQAHIPSIHKSGALYTTKFKDVGNSIVEVNFILHNFGNDLLDYFSMPWGGVRASSLPQCWLSKTDHTLERTYKKFSGDDPGVANIDDTGGYFIWAAEGEDESRPALAIVFGKDSHYNDWRTEYNMLPMRIRFGDGTDNPARDYSVFVVNPRLNVQPGNSFFYRTFYVSGTMKEVHEKARLLVSNADYGFINPDPGTSSYAKIVSADFDNALEQDIRLFASPVKNMIPLFLMENTETGKRYISPDLYYNVTTEPFDNPYDPSDPEYEIYQDRYVNKPYDGKIEYIRLVGYGVEKGKIRANIEFALLDTLILDTTRIVLTEEYKNRIWIPTGPCSDCALIPEVNEGLLVYNDFDEDQLYPWENPLLLNFSDNIDNPDISPENPDLKVARAVRDSGLWAHVRFQLPDYLELDENSLFKVKVYYQGEEPLPANCKVRMILRNDGLGLTQYSQEKDISSANEWNEYTFTINPANLKDTFNQVWLFFSSPDYDGSATGQVFYVDDLMGPPLLIDREDMILNITPNGDSIIIDLSQNPGRLNQMTDPVFTLTKAGDDEPVMINNITYDTSKIYLHIEDSETLSGRDELLLSYQSGQISDEDGKLLPYFNERAVNNNIPLTTFYLNFEVNDVYSGNPLQEVVFTSDTLTETTDQNGMLTFLLPANTWQFTYSYIGYFSGDTIVDLNADTTLNILLRKSSANLRFEISDGSEPLPMAEVKSGDSIKTSDSEGKVLYEDLPVDKDYIFNISLLGFTEETDTIFLAKDTTIHVVLNHLEDVNTNSFTMKIYPVPAGDYLMVESATEVQSWEIYDIAGKCLLRKKINGERTFRIDLPGLEPAVYFLRFIDKSKKVKRLKFNVVK